MSFGRPASGRPTPGNSWTTASAWSSTDCSMASRANSPLRIGRCWPRPRKTRPAATSTRCCGGGSSPRTRPAAEAPAIPWSPRRRTPPAIGRRGRLCQAAGDGRL